MRRMRTAMLRVWLGGAVIAGFGTLSAQDGPVTNFDLVRDAARSACRDLSGKLPESQRGSMLAVHSVGSHDGSFMVENTLTAELAVAGFQVRALPDSTGPVLEFEVVDLGITYTRSWRHAWLGEKRVAREARARIFARLLDQDTGGILWGEQAEAKVVDEIAQEDLPSVEEKGSSDYLKATLPPQGWNKLVEPVVVTGIVVGLIVLFFANQDTSN